MNGGERLTRILARLAHNEEALPGAHLLCVVAAEVTEMSGAGVMLLRADAPLGSLCTSDAVSEVVEDLHYTLGEGPGVDAHTLGRAVTEPDLADPALSRWPAFAPAAVAAGARAVFSFPVRIGAVRLGALNLYRDGAGPLGDDIHADALVMADVVARAILAMQADAVPGALAADLEEGLDLQPVVHQAAGMVSVQLGVSVADALIRLRARAFATNRRIGEVASDVVNRRLRFDRS